MVVVVFSAGSVIRFGFKLVEVVALEVILGVVFLFCFRL